MDKFYRETSHYSAKYCEEYWGPAPPKGRSRHEKQGQSAAAGPQDTINGAYRRLCARFRGQ